MATTTSNSIRVNPRDRGPFRLRSPHQLWFNIDSTDQDRRSNRGRISSLSSTSQGVPPSSRRPFIPFGRSPRKKAPRQPRRGATRITLQDDTNTSRQKNQIAATWPYQPVSAAAPPPPMTATEPFHIPSGLLAKYCLYQQNSSEHTPCHTQKYVESKKKRSNQASFPNHQGGFCPGIDSF